uniref:M16 family metallopeptidase n=1 Tax=Flavobacterium sp. TaxID=239 RepID=UPI00404AFCEA
MNTKFIIITALLFLTFNSHAQIDRSKQPAPGPAPAINLGSPETFTLPNGLKVMVVEDHKLPRVSINLTIDNDPYATGEKNGVEDLTGSLIGLGTTLTPKDKFNEEVDFMGASLSFYSSGAYAYSLSKYFERVLEMMAEGALMPNFTQEELDKQRDQMVEGLKSEEKSASTIARRVGNVLAYGEGHPFGEFMTEETLNNVTLDDVKKYYNEFFVPQNAYLIVIGDVKFKDVKKKVTKLFEKWKKATAPKVSYTDPKNVQFTQINFIDVPSAVQAEVSLVNTVRLTMNDPDYFPALIANEILGGSFDSYLNLTLREEKAWTYGARSSIGASKNITTFRAGASLKMATVDSAVVEIVTQINRIRNAKVSMENLENAKAAYVGNFVRQFAKPEAVSRYALTVQTQNLSADFYEHYLQSINAVTQEDVRRVAQKYFLVDNARIIVAGKASEVADKLEATGIPVMYFDKWGTRIEKPKAKVVASDVTGQVVLNNYFKAIGGMDAVQKVKSVSMNGIANMQGAPQPLVYVLKTDVKGKMMSEVTMGGMSVMKQVFNETKGYIVQQGQRVELTEDMIGPMKATAHPFPEMALLTEKDLTVAGVENFDGEDAYGIKQGDVIHYYSVATGLKVADVISTPMGTQTLKYKDYKAVKDVLFPYNFIMNIGVDLDFNMDEIKVNENVTEADFK